MLHILERGVDMSEKNNYAAVYKFDGTLVFIDNSSAAKTEGEKKVVLNEISKIALAIIEEVALRNQGTSD